jgi:hypothetical protein
MGKSSGREEKKAGHGEKMIEVKIRFWTNNIAPRAGRVVPKHAWSAGVVRMERNASHGIVPGKPRVFRSLLDVGATVEKVLIDHGIVLHVSDSMRRYLKHGPDITDPASR